jgi:ABC-type transport system involved in multi-copper enzyme maturation permease subunit
MTPSMQRTILWRLLWKEYRVQRAFWLCIAIMAVVLMGLFRMTVTGVDHDPIAWLFGAAMVLPAVFAAACGGMLFAAEDEAGTRDFQRSLPLSSSQLLLAKGVFSLAGILALYVATWCAAALFGGLSLTAAIAKIDRYTLMGQLPNSPRLYEPGPASFLSTAEWFLWAALFSLSIRRPLTATIAGAAAATAIAAVIPTLAGGYADIVSLRLIVAAALAALDVRLALGWLGEERGSSPHRSGRAPRRSEAEPASTAVARGRPSALASLRAREESFSRVVLRLLWVQWRQSQGLLIVFGVLCVPLVVELRSIAKYVGETSAETMSGSNLAFQYFLVIVLALAAFPLAGAVAFLGEQQRQYYRFFTDRGVRPSHIWLSRQLSLAVVAGLLTAVLSAIAISLLLLAALNLRSHDIADLRSPAWQLLLFVGSLGLLCVAAGQFCSMVFRNSFLAVFFALLISIVLAIWYGLTRLWEVNWFWSVLPIPLAFLLATWLRTPHWLVERKTLRAWLPAALALFVPAAALVTAVALHRIYEVPSVTPGFSTEELTRPETAAEQAAIDLYQKARMSINFKPVEKKVGNVGTWDLPENSERLQLSNARIAWVDANSRAIAMAMEISRGKELYLAGSLARSTEATTLHDAAYRLAQLLLCSGLELEERGDLDAALDRYLATVRISVQVRHCTDSYCYHSGDVIEQMTYQVFPYWAARPKQTPARIIAAAAELDKITANLPPDKDGLKREYLRLHRALSGGFPAIIANYGGSHEELIPLTWLWSHLPWERARALRLLDVLTRRQLDELDEVQAAAGRGDAIPQPPYALLYHRQMEFPYALHRAICVPPILGDLQSDQANRIRCYTGMLALRRGIRLSLILEAWKLRHGALPKRLDELIGHDLAHIPIDPITGIPFRFVRDGGGIPLHWQQEFRYGFVGGGNVAANVPFVWSAGTDVIFTGLREGQTDPDRFDYRIVDEPWREKPYQRFPNSDYDLWEAGMSIPVP